MFRIETRVVARHRLVEAARALHGEWAGRTHPRLCSRRRRDISSQVLCIRKTRDDAASWNAFVTAAAAAAAEGRPLQTKNR